MIGVVNKTGGVPALPALIPTAEGEAAALSQPTNTVNLRCDSGLMGMNDSSPLGRS